MDLGECPNIHELALRADFERATKEKDYFYDVDVSLFRNKTLVLETDVPPSVYRPASTFARSSTTATGALSWPRSAWRRRKRSSRRRSTVRCGASLKSRRG